MHSSNKCQVKKSKNEKARKKRKIFIDFDSKYKCRRTTKNLLFHFYCILNLRCIFHSNAPKY